MNDLTIRKITHSDIPESIEILRALPQWFGIEEAILGYQNDLKSLDGFVAIIASVIVGFVGLKRYGNHAIEINVIGVHPSHRRKGIGAKLLEHVESQAASPDTKLLHMKTLAPSHSDPNYAETRAFWEANGYIPMDAHLLWGPDNPCQVMVKPLTSSDA